MQATADADVLDQMLDPVARCLTPDAARRLVALRAAPEIQSRIDSLAAKANSGELTPDDRAKYSSYVEALDFIAILQAKARALLADSGTND